MSNYILIPTGAAGPQGPQGPQGTPGTPGTSGGAAGAPTAAWTVAAWWIDPVNGSDTNSGTSVGAPLKTWFQLIQLFGTYSPIIGQNTTITWLSSQSDNSDPVIFTPYINNSAVITITGNSTVVATGTLSSVTAINRNTSQLWQANIGQAVANFLAPTFSEQSTQAIMSVGTGTPFIATGVYAWPYTQVSTDVCTFSQPLSFTANTGIGTANTMSSISSGNAYQMLQFKSVNFVQLDAKIIEFNVPYYNNGIVINQLHFYDPQGATNDDVYVGNYVQLVECAIDKEIIAIHYTTDSNVFLQNCSFNGSILTPPGSIILGGLLAGVEISGQCNPTQGPVVDGNVILFNGGQCKTTASVGNMYIEDTWTFEIDGIVAVGEETQYGYGVTGAALWGPGSILVTQRGGLFYPGNPATGCFLIQGSIEINSLTTAYSIGPTGVWNASIPITPRALDHAAGLSGFGGMAINPCGGIISNQKV